jgi:enoyl-CoA hydratase/carnithine racemase
MSDSRALVTYERQGHTALIRMQRPERLNALSIEFMHHLADAWVQFRDDDEAWIGVLAGTDRAFSTGMDIKERMEMDRPYLAKVPEWPYNPWWEQELDKPTIAAVQGYAFGGGFFFASRCDLRIAADDAVFQVTEPIRGGIAGYELLLYENIPYAIAAELAVGSTISAERALQVGFVNRLAPSDQVVSAALAWAEEICAAPPLAVHHNLRLLRDIRRDRARITYWQAREVDRVWGELNASRDTREAFDSFIEKRSPVYGRH